MHCPSKRFDRILACLVIFSFLVATIRADNFYLAQVAQGAGTGADAADAMAAAFFNNSKNWASPTKAPGKIGPGDTVHLCGTISTPLTVQASGTVGSVITILFEPGAKLSAPTWNSAAAIELGSNSYITVDGGASGTIGGYNGNPSLANGIIESTANGTALANQNDDKGIDGIDCSNIMVKGILFRNLYVRTAGGTDANKYGCGLSAHYGGGTSSNITCTNCIFHDMSTGVFFGYGASSSNFVMSYCTAYNTNWGGAAGDDGPATSLNGLLVDHCYFYNWLSWSSTDSNVWNVLHHNGFYTWAEIGGSVTGITYSNNFCGPGYGNNATAALFISGNAINGLINNNTCIADSTGNPGEGLIFVEIHGGSQAGTFRIYNNTLVSTAQGIGINVYQGNGASLTAYDVENNLISGLGTAIVRFYNGDSTLTADYNIGYNLASGQEYSDSSGNSAGYLSFTQWQAAGYDTHGSNGNPNLNAGYVPQPVSSAIGAGANLSSYFTTDAAGDNRPSSPTAWDIGAYQYVASGSTVPTITTQPVSQTVATGASVAFTVAASGTPAPTYQWRLNGANISGANGITLTLSNVTAANDGTYQAVATNSAGSATSNGAVLTVNSAPVITTQPVSQTVATGANVTFMVAASGTPAPTYQWQFNGINISGATGTSLTLTNVTTVNAGTYQAVVTNSAGSATSNGAVLTVNSAPVITTQPANQTVAPGASVTFTVGASGMPAPSYQWQLNGVNISGATGATLTLNSVTTANDGTYIAVATNSVGSATSNGAVLSVIANAPVITTQPASQTVATGTTVTFTVAASGTPAPTYQWQFNGINISGATGTSLTLTNVTTVNAGTYQVVVTNSAGSATSNGAVLTVNSAPVITTQPANQTVAAGTSATFTVAATGTGPLSYQWDLNDFAIIGATKTSYTVADAQIGNAGVYSVTVSNSAGSTNSAMVTLLVDANNSTAYLQYPTGIVCDNAGNLYVVDAVQNVVEKIAGGQISILAGASGITGARDRTGTSAQFNQPTGITMSPLGNIVVADSGNSTIREVTPAGVVTTLAGSAFAQGNVDGIGLAAEFNKPTGVASDTAGDLFVADVYADTIRKITAVGAMVTTFAGTNMVAGATNATGSAALFSEPTGVAMDAAGNIYVADAFNDLIREITPAGAVKTLAGKAGVAGYADGTGTNALFNQPSGIAVDLTGNIYVADTGNSLIRKITTVGVVSTIAGTPTVVGLKDGPVANGVEFSQPHGLCIDAGGNIYVADTGNGVIRKIDPTGNTTTLTLKAASSPTQPSNSTSGTQNSAPSDPAGPSAAGGAGGGAMDPWFIAVLATLAMARYWRRNR